MKYFHSWSGGKDSTASVILDHVHGLPPSTIIFSEVMFDVKRGISGELPEHIDFVMNKAKPLFESWGYNVEIVRAKKGYSDIFFEKVGERTKIEERRGKYKGWLIGGICSANRELKIRPIREYYKAIDLSGEEYTQYVGIGIDEPERLERLRGTNKVSLLECFGYTEQMAYDLCEQYGLLSPTYEFTKRGGCWFCPNSSYKSYAHLKEHHRELWEELRELDKEENVVSHNFKYDKTFSEVEAIVDEEIRDQQNAKLQMTLFDFI